MNEIYPLHYPRCTNPSDADCMRDCDGCEWLEGDARMSEHIIETEISNGALFIPYQSKLSEAVREEIVRCRDCRFASLLNNGMYDCTGDLVETWDYYNDEPKRNQVPPDGYCRWGEQRREGGE